MDVDVVVVVVKMMMIKMRRKVRKGARYRLVRRGLL